LRKPRKKCRMKNNYSDSKSSFARFD